ncbi:neuropeptide FF receptor 1-like [Montipora capricornis]|uniref:neuropeptide FF receptor 1-like n=1 Tax=Montipora capricornis TaxID=246305 RepID=UPI0035F1721E
MAIVLPVVSLATGDRNAPKLSVQDLKVIFWVTDDRMMEKVTEKLTDSVMFDSIDITIATVRCLIDITSIAGNLLVCAVVMRRDMRYTDSFQLSSFELCCGGHRLSFLLLFSYFIYRHSLNNPDAMPVNAICLSLEKLAWMGANCSVFSLIVIARERYCAVVHPHSIQHKLTWRKLKDIIPGTWIIAALLSSRGFVIQSFEREIAVRSCDHFWDDKKLQKASYQLIYVTFVGISSLLLIGYYSIVVYTLWFKHDDQDQRQIGMQLLPVHGVLKVRIRVTFMVLSVTTLFEITWISDNVMHVLKEFGLCVISDVAFPIAHTMIVFNSAVNPFAYALINHRFREKMKGMLCNSLCASERNIKADHPRIIRLWYH